MRGNASLDSRYMVAPNTSSVHTIRPIPGSIRKPPLEARTLTPEPDICASEASMASDDERGQQARHESVEEARLGKGEAQPLQLRDLVAHLRLACDCLDRLAEDHADADTGANCTEASD